MRRGLALVLAVALYGAVDQVRLARIPVRMKAFVDRGTAAGFVTLVAVKGKVVQLSAVGYQDRETKTPMRTDTIFEVMSLTKAVTVASVMTLVDEGKVGLTEPVEKYLPEFKGEPMKDGSQPVRPVQVADLMSHTSGLPNGYPVGYKDLDVKYDRTLQELVLAIGKTPLEAQPGTVWRYTGAGMAALARIVEVVSGMTYADYVTEKIFLPLGMKDSYFYLPAEKRPRLATVYTDDHGVLKKANVNAYREGSIYPAPDGGLYSTAPDYYRFYQMLMNRGTLDGKKVLSPESVEAMTTNHTGELKAGFAPGQGYGFGLCVVRSTEGMFRGNSIGTFSHGGSWRTYAFGDPKKDLVGIVMYQRTNGGGDVAEETTAFIEMANAAVR